MRIITGDALTELRGMPDESVHCCVSSPPYFGLRDYGTAKWAGGNPQCDHRSDTRHQSQGATSARSGRANIEDQRNENFRHICGKCGARRIDQQIGLEPSPDEFVCALVGVFREVRRVLRKDATLWLNMGDSYANGGRDTYGTFKPDTKQATQAAIKSAPRNTDPVGIKPKDLMGIPWMLAFALRADGWYLRSEIIWHKPNPMPESVTDRPTKSHEQIFLLSKTATYYYDADSIKEDSITGDPRRPYTSEGAWQLDGRPAEQRHGGEIRNTYRQPNSPGSIKSPHGQGFTRRALGDKGAEAPDEVRASSGARMGRGVGWRDDPTTTPLARNKRSVWTVATAPYSEAHFATFPPALIEPCIKAGCPVGGTVLDPFGGAGTTGLVADRLDRSAILIELNPAYAEMARQRIYSDAPLFVEVA